MAVAKTAFRLPPLPTISEIIRLYNLRAKKQLSQNFLLDSNLSKKFVRSAGDLSGAHVCEVGPGPGGITRAILESGVHKLTVVEKDIRFMPGLELLKEATGGDLLQIFHGDILLFDTTELFSRLESSTTATDGRSSATDPVSYEDRPGASDSLWSKPPPNLHMMGNLPFSVSTALIIRWLEAVSSRTGAWRNGRVPMTLTFQEEVAVRMAAPQLHRQRCRLSVMCQYLCHVDHKFTVPGRAFVPPPDVDVGVVTLVPRKTPLIEDLPFKLVEKVVRHVFQYRQKMCKHGLQTLFPPEQPDLTRRLVHEAELRADAQSFTLAIDDFARICRVYKTLCDEQPGLFEFDFRSQENAERWRKSRSPLGFI